MSIFKSTFKPDIQRQLKARQDALIKRTPQTLQYYNSRNAWIRVTSSVNVKGTSDLAKKYVLQGGILDPNLKLRAGLGQDGSYSNVSPDGQPYRLGIRPMPGITGMNVKSKSAYGSLREATINFVAWDIKQLEELELLYMRPGYSVLVEWGWSPYLVTSDTLNTSVPYIDDVLNGGVSKEDIWKKTFTQASTGPTAGNYDSLYGFIKNYSWAARPDGGYDCTTTIISIGEIVESLKINYGAYDTDITTKGIWVDQTGAAPRPFTKGSNIEKSYAQNKLAGICNELYLILTKVKNISNYGKATFNGWDFFRFDLTVAANSQDESDFNDSAQIYITLKSFIDVLNKYVLIEDSKNKKPLVEISLTEGEHMEFPGADLFCLGHFLQVSMDPTICLIKNPIWQNPKENLGIKGDFETLTQIMKDLDKDYWKLGDVQKQYQFGIIGNIYVNLSYIYSLVTSKEIEAGDRKEKNDIAVYDFLKNLMNGISAAIGNVATFDVITDPIDGKARIIDINFTDSRNRAEIYKNAFKLEVHNLKSTVRSYKLESQIFPEQSSIIAIGAQAKGGALGENVNTLIDFNQNLEDRIIPKKDAPNSNPETDPKKLNEKQSTNLKESLNIIAEFAEYISTRGGLFGFFRKEFDRNQTSKYVNALKDIISIAKSCIENDISNRNLIPTKLSVDLDGIGGIVIGNIFKIPDDILPRGYKGDDKIGKRIGYVVMGLGHSIQDNDWKTTIDTQFIILDNPDNENKLTIAEFKKLILTERAKETNKDLSISGDGGGGEQSSSNIPAATGTGNINYMKQAGNAVFKNSGKNSRCAQYTYNIARDYTDSIKGKPVKGLIEPAGGNANDAAYRNRLVALGYTMYSLGTLTKKQLLDKINGSWDVGDIINYKSTVPVGGNNYAYIYGHTQIYTDRAIDIGGKNGGGSNKTPWASSWADNYGVNFVYNSKDSNSWETYVFKAPGSSLTSTTTSAGFDAKKTADALFDAMNGCGSGFNTVKTILTNQVFTEKEWSDVVSAYSTRTVTCAFGKNYTGGLRGTIIDQMDSDAQLKTLQDILISKGIKQAITK